MILRRLTENLKQQHWTAIGIELVIVVPGVFIGMQVSNWNEDRETNLKSAFRRTCARKIGATSF